MGDIMEKEHHADTATHNNIGKRPARFLSKEERLKKNYDKRLADWSSRKTPPIRASLPLGQGWSVSLIRDDVVPDDPGMGCPASVSGPFGRHASLHTALSIGMVTDAKWEEQNIPHHIYKALEVAEDYAYAYIDLVTDWMEKK